MSNIYVTIVRTGKQAKTQEIPGGSSVRDLFVAAGFNSDDYTGWAVTDEDGDTLHLDDTLNSSTTLICGAQVDGAVRVSPVIIHDIARLIQLRAA